MTNIDIIKENIQFQKLVKYDLSTIILQNEYLIPDTQPDVQEIMMVDTKPIITGQKIMNDKIIIEGNIEYTIIYIPRDDNEILNSVKYSEKFTSFADIVNGDNNISFESECKVEHIEAHIMNERKIQIDGVMNVTYEIFKTRNFDFVKDIENSNNIQVLKKQDTINRLISSKEFEVLSKSVIRIGMDKPQVFKILNTSLTLHKKDIKVGEDKIYFTCYCKVKILYLGAESKEVISIEDDVFLSKEEEMIGAYSEMTSYASYGIKNSEIQLEDDDLGEARIINTEFLLAALVKVFSMDNVEIMKDAYSTKHTLNLNKKVHEIELLKGIQSTESIIKDNIYIKEGDIPPENIVVTLGNVLITEKNVLDGKVVVEGVLKANILYKTSREERFFGNIQGDIPFTIAVDMPFVTSKMSASANCTLENIEAAIEVNTIAIRGTVSLSVKVCCEEEKEFIEDVIESEEEIKTKKASVTIYVVGNGDTLWKLAKRFNTTVEELVKINNIEDENVINPGEKLIIPGRAIF
ncbi:MAG: DUF3794 domain-containing protein [Clostridiales bacterium]|nr:DUF3794 domain-containing protein [Clostridiales bacterium]